MWSVFAQFLLAAMVLPAPQGNEGTPPLARVQAIVKQEIDTLPNYVCLATVERFQGDNNGKRLRRIASVKFDIAHTGDREMYALPGDTAFRESPDTLVGLLNSGLPATGEFSGHVREIFFGPLTQIAYSGPDKLKDRTLERWTFFVPASASNWTLSVEGAIDNPHSEGAFWVDPATGDVVQCQIRAKPTKPFPSRDIVRTILFERVQVGERRPWLPVRIEFSLVTSEGLPVRNVTTYTNCRQFAGQSTIKFDSPDR